MNTLNPITKAAINAAKEAGEIRLGSWGVHLFITLPNKIGEVHVKPDARGFITLARVRAALRSQNV